LRGRATLRDTLRDALKEGRATADAAHIVSGGALYGRAHGSMHQRAHSIWMAKFSYLFPYVSVLLFVLGPVPITLCCRMVSTWH
jgi:hypothetical protein